MGTIHTSPTSFPADRSEHVCVSAERYPRERIFFYGQIHEEHYDQQYHFYDMSRYQEPQHIYSNNNADSCNPNMYTNNQTAGEENEDGDYDDEDDNEELDSYSRSWNPQYPYRTRARMLGDHLQGHE